MFKVLILQASHSLSDERTEYLIKDRLSFMRFLGLSLSPTACRTRTRSGTSGRR
jgi:IS5 family transposase